MENYYDILNIPKNAGEEEIKKALRTLAMQYHPDKNPGDKIAEEKFKKVNEAYSVLSDPIKKRDYDLKLQYNPYGAGNASSRPFSENVFTEEDIFNGAGFDFGTFTWSSSARNKKEEKLSRKEALHEFLTGILYTVLGIVLIRSFIFLGIFGLILSFSVISNGIRKIKKAYSAVFK